MRFKQKVYKARTIETGRREATVAVAAAKILLSRLNDIPLYIDSRQQLACLE